MIRYRSPYMNLDAAVSALGAHLSDYVGRAHTGHGAIITEGPGY
jgi:hypothetical protein